MDFKSFGAFVWLVICAINFALFTVMSVVQIYRALFIFHDGFQSWMIIMSGMPIITFLLVKSAWEEYKEEEDK